MNVYETPVIVYHPPTARKTIPRITTNSLPIFNLWPRVKAVSVYDDYSNLDEWSAWHSVRGETRVTMPFSSIHDNLLATVRTTFELLP